jgi:hypothetical protein
MCTIRKTLHSLSVCVLIVTAAAFMGSTQCHAKRHPNYLMNDELADTLFPTRFAATQTGAIMRADHVDDDGVDISLSLLQIDTAGSVIEQETLMRDPLPLDDNAEKLAWEIMHPGIRYDLSQINADSKRYPDDDPDTLELRHEERENEAEENSEVRAERAREADTRSTIQNGMQNGMGDLKKAKGPFPSQEDLDAEENQDAYRITLPSGKTLVVSGEAIGNVDIQLSDGKHVYVDASSITPLGKNARCSAADACANAEQEVADAKAEAADAKKQLAEQTPLADQLSSLMNQALGSGQEANAAMQAEERRAIQMIRVVELLECPPEPCDSAVQCPMTGGVCCGAHSGFCCPPGSYCLGTDPPTCYHDDKPKEDPLCAEEYCRPGHKCGLAGVEVCCRGGTTCCPMNFTCTADSPAQCAELLDADQIQFQQEHLKKYSSIVQARLQSAAANPPTPVQHGPTLPKLGGNSAGKQSTKRAARRQQAQQQQSNKTRSGNEYAELPKGDTYLCGLAKGPSCPNGWSKKSMVALTSMATRSAGYPFTTGFGYVGSGNSSSAGAAASSAESTLYKWVHPFLCCTNSVNARLDGMMTFNSHNIGDCMNIRPTIRNDDIKTEAGKHFATPHSRYNANWSWLTGFSCPSQPDDTVATMKGCLFGKYQGCPKGFTDRGVAGMLFRTNRNPKPLLAGGPYNSYWKWSHPTACCQE